MISLNLWCRDRLQTCIYGVSPVIIFSSIMDDETIYSIGNYTGAKLVSSLNSKFCKILCKDNFSAVNIFEFTEQVFIIVNKVITGRIKVGEYQSITL